MARGEMESAARTNCGLVRVKSNGERLLRSARHYDTRVWVPDAEGGSYHHSDTSRTVATMPMPGDDRAPGDSAPEERWKKAIDRVLNSGLMFPHMGEFWAYVDGEITWDEFDDRMSP